MKNAVNKIPWLEIAVFYVTAVVVSAPFRLGYIAFDLMEELPFGLNIFFHIFRAAGPLAGFLLVVYVCRTRVKRSITFLGQNAKASLIAIVPIVAGLSVAGVANNKGIQENYFGFITAIMLVIYALFEEYGWRAYLQQVLQPLKMIYKVFLISTLWYLWHLNFLNPHISLQTHLIHYLSLMLGSWGLLKISEATSSLLFVSAVHLVFNVLMDVNTEFSSRLIIASAAIATWTILLFYLKKSRKQLSPKSKQPYKPDNDTDSIK